MYDLDMLLRKYEMRGEIYTSWDGDAFRVMFFDMEHEAEIERYCFDYAKRINGYFQTAEMYGDKYLIVKK